jgi:predicted GNAT family acetyltransferase
MPNTSTLITALEIHEDSEQKKFFAIVSEEECFLKYRYLADDTVDFFSTYVPKELGGRGYAAQLVEHALKFVRGQALKVVPSCSYVRAYIAKHPEYQNLLA